MNLKPSFIRYSRCKLDSYLGTLKVKVKLATLVEGDPKAPFSIATTRRCCRGRYSISRTASLYP